MNRTQRTIGAWYWRHAVRPEMRAVWVISVTSVLALVAQLAALGLFAKTIRGMATGTAMGPDLAYLVLGIVALTSVYPLLGHMAQRRTLEACHRHSQSCRLEGPAAGACTALLETALSALRPGATVLAALLVLLILHAPAAIVVMAITAVGTYAVRPVLASIYRSSITNMSKGANNEDVLRARIETTRSGFVADVTGGVAIAALLLLALLELVTGTTDWPQWALVAIVGRFFASCLHGLGATAGRGAMTLARVLEGFPRVRASVVTMPGAGAGAGARARPRPIVPDAEAPVPNAAGIASEAP